MARKLLITFAVLIFLFGCGVCYAEERNSTINLGNEMVNALDDAKTGVENVTDDIMNTTDKDRVVENNKYKDTENYTQKYTNSYNAYRTIDDTATTTNTMMNTTTWIWIILALAAIIIVAMIWYYAVQSTDKKD